MRFHYGPPPEDPDFQPDIQGWHPIREPGPVQVQLIALPVALGLFLLLGWITVRQTGLEPTSMLLSVETLFILLVLIPIHEGLHLLVQPGYGFSGDSIIGVWLSRAVIYASYLGAMSRSRFLACLVAPFTVLTVLPLVALLVLAPVSSSGPPLKILTLVCLLNAIASAGDLVGLGLILAQVPRSAILRDKGWRTFWNLPGEPV